MKIRVRIVRGGKGPSDYTAYVRIPKQIFESLGRPECFELKLEDGKIILVPCRKQV